MNSGPTVEQRELVAWAAAYVHPSQSVDASAVALDLDSAGTLADAARTALRHRIEQQGWVVYHAPAFESRSTVAELCNRFALGPADRTLTGPQDGLVELRDSRAGTTARYTPYSRRALGWHTDGYYNPSTRTIRAFVLHCVRPALRGGANAMIDPRRVAHRIYASDPTLLAALGAPDVMTIPANMEGSTVLRAEASVPVFAIASDGELVMRFTNRSTHLHWREGVLFERARAALLDAIEAESATVNRIVLKSGQGLLCNNVLHCREAFEDSESSATQGAGRLLLRGRYLAPVVTSVSKCPA